MTAHALVLALLIAAAFGGLAELTLIGMAFLREVGLRFQLLHLAYRREAVVLPAGWESGACSSLQGRLVGLQDRQQAGREREAARRAYPAIASATPRSVFYQRRCP